MTVELLSLTLGRDPFSMVSHLLGALLSLGVTVLLVRRARAQGLKGRGVALYGLMMTLTFAASALFHYVDSASPRLELYKRIDHAAIFLMIAGTGTAIYASLRTSWANRLIAILWGLTLIGIVVKLVWWNMALWMTALVYLALGWVGCMGLIALARAVGWRPLWLFFAGGLAFSVGAVVFATGWPVVWTGVLTAHDVFHVLVLLGAALHCQFIYAYCTDPDAFRVMTPPEMDLDGLQVPLFHLFVNRVDGA